MPDMQIDTDKMAAIRNAAGVDDIELIPAAIHALRRDLAVLSHKVFRHTTGLFRAIPLTDEEIDAMIDDLMKRAGRRQAPK